MRAGIKARFTGDIGGHGSEFRLKEFGGKYVEMDLAQGRLQPGLAKH